MLSCVGEIEESFGFVRTSILDVCVCVSVGIGSVSNNFSKVKVLLPVCDEANCLLTQIYLCPRVHSAEHLCTLTGVKGVGEAQ